MDRAVDWVVASVKLHRLKCWPEPFAATAAGFKSFEFRQDDRHFEPGDVLVLCEWVPVEGEPYLGHYTGARAVRGVTYVLRHPNFGVPEGYVILSLSGSGSSGWPAG
jgi:ParB family chromosome partitioning protein